MNWGIRYVILVWLNLLAASCFAAAIQANSIDGLWQQFDDKDGQLNSLVRIETHNNKTSATIIKGYAKPNKPLDPNALCSQCPDPFHNQPLVGLQFLWDLQSDGNEWTNGQILDPNEGKIYRAKATLSADGNQLTVRGFIGLSLFGRNQTWVRAGGE